MKMMMTTIRGSKHNRLNSKLRIQLKSLNNKYRMFNKFSSRIHQIKRNHKGKKELK